MSLEAFLAEGKSHEQSDEGFVTIAKVQIRWAFRSGIGPTSKFFAYSYGDTEGKTQAEVDCQAEIGNEKWPDGKQKRPVFGLLTEIHGNNVPTSPDGKRWQTMPNEIWPDFIEAYANDGVFARMKDLSDEEKNSVRGPMPYTAVTNSLIEINAPVRLFGEPTWCKLSQEIDQWEQLKVVRGKRQPRMYEEKEVPYRFWLIRYVYKNKAEADTDAELIKAGQGQPVTQPQPINGQLSALAIEKWGQEGALSVQEILNGMKTQKASIKNFIQNLQNGIGTEGGKKLSMPDAQSVAANGHGMERSDLPLIGIKDVEIAF